MKPSEIKHYNYHKKDYYTNKCHDKKRKNYCQS